MKSSYRKRFDAIAVFKLTQADFENIRQLSRQLDLSISETLRRATRIGRKFLSESYIPGSAREERSTR
jgi:hypothetical protein